MFNTIAPRFSSLPAGFTRIQRLPRRRNDKAEASVIEILGNKQSEFEKNEEAVEKEEYGIKSFWEWEQGLLDQEEIYWENKLRNLKI